MKEKCLFCGKTIERTEKGHYGLHVDCFKSVFHVNKLGNFENWQRKDNTSKGNPAQIEKPYLSSFFAGNYRKYEAVLLGTRYIFKFGNKDCPELSAVEYLCNLIGLQLKIPVPTPFALIKGDKEISFVTKNFVQDYGSHHNLVHLYHYLPEREEAYTVENVLDAIGQNTQNPDDVNTFIKVLIYDALIGNHDRHGRNLALIETGKGKRLSPIYDNISALGLESGELLLADWNPAGKIAVKNNKDPGMKEYLTEIIRLGYANVVTEFISKLSEEVVLELVKNAFYLSAQMRQAFSRLLNKRIKELKNAS